MASIKHKFFSSSIWVVVGRGSSSLSSFLVFLLLARLLGPIEFGIVAFASVFVDITRSLALAGTPQALVQRKEWDDGVASTAFWTNLALAILLAIVLTLGVGSLLWRFYSPQMFPIIAALSLTFVIDSARAAHEAKLQREFKFKQLAARTVAASVVGGFFGIVLAFYGAGAWALVASRLMSSLLQTLVVWWAVKWTPRLHFSVTEARTLLAFGSKVSAMAVLGQLNFRIPDLVVGAFLGPTSVGMYRVGSRVVTTVGTLVVTPVLTTALAAFSRLKDPQAIGEAYFRLSRVSSVLACPVYFGMAAVAQDFVVVAFGERWAESGPVMLMLSLMGGATIFTFAQPALIAAGRPGMALVTSIGSAVGTLVVALVFAPFGIVWLALGIALRSYITLPLGLALLHRATGLKTIRVVRGLAPQFFASTLMLGVVLLVRHFWLQPFSPGARLLFEIPLGAVSFAALMLLFGRHILRGVRSEIVPLLKGGKRAAITTDDD